MSTPIKTGWLKDKEGNKFAPKTLTSQVQTSDGVLLEDYVNTETGKLSEAIAELNDELAALPQSDWDQNDDTALDYIENRTHFRYTWDYLPASEVIATPSVGATALIIPTNASTFKMHFNPTDIVEETYGSLAFKYDALSPWGTVPQYRYITDIDLITMLDDVNYKTVLFAYASVFIIRDNTVLSDEYSELFPENGIYLYCSEDCSGKVANIQVGFYLFSTLDEHYFSNRIARTADVNAKVEELTTEIDTKLVAPESATAGQFIKVLEVDDAGNVIATEAVDEPDEDDALELVAELGLAEPMTDDEGNVLTDENGVLFIL